MKLMQKYLKKEKISGIDNLTCWLFDFSTICFISDITSTTLLGNLIKINMVVDYLNYS